MKEIVGIPRPHLVEDFLHSLHSKMAATSGTTGVVELPQVLIIPSLIFKTSFYLY